jgi:hypothetical protein
MGELYKKQLIEEELVWKFLQNTMFSSANDDFSPSTSSSSSLDHTQLECVCRLLSTAGQLLESPKTIQQMDKLCDRLEHLSRDLRLPSRIRYLQLLIFFFFCAGCIHFQHTF